MKRFLLLAVLVLSLGFTSAQTSDELDRIEQLTGSAVLIDTPSSMGSGVLFTRTDWTGTNTITFVWTAAHVVEDDRQSLISLFMQGSDMSEHRAFSAVEVVQGTNRVNARVIAWSGPYNGEDLALLVMDDNDGWERTVSFQLCDFVPRLGQRLFNVSSPGGSDGYNSFSRGEISFVGRIHNGILFDQTSTVVFPGSSGGGVYLEDGHYVGMIVRLFGPALNLVVPVRRMESWATHEKLLWALDPSVPMPSEEVFKALTP